MKILEKNKSKLIDRTEFLIEYPHTQKPTPTNNEIKKELAKELKTKEELIIIKNIITKFGEGTSTISAFAYDNLEELKKLEKYVEPKKEEPAKEETPKTEETKPTEDVKEEPKEDVKETETKEQAAE